MSQNRPFSGLGPALTAPPRAGSYCCNEGCRRYKKDMKKKAAAAKKTADLAAKPVQARCKSLLGDIPPEKMAELAAYMATLQQSAAV